MIKYVLSFVFISSVLQAVDQEDQVLMSSSQKKIFKQENKTVNDGVSKAIESQVKSQSKHHIDAAASSSGAADVMIVDPKVVSQDWVDAFNTLLSKRIPNVVFIMHDHTTISDVSEMEAMPGGYLMLFTQKTIKGPKFKIVKTSNIASLTTD